MAALRLTISEPRATSNRRPAGPVRALVRWSLVLLSVLSPRSGAAESGVAPAAPPPLRVVMDDDYPPYVFRNEDGRVQGILPDQWRLFSERTGRRVELTAVGWSEAQRRMLAGEFDVIDTIFENERRSQLYDFLPAYARLDVPLFFHADLSGIRNAKDVRGFVVAVKRGDNAIDVLREQGVTHLVEYPSYQAIVLAARDGRVQVFTIDRPPALYLLHKLGIADQFRETEPLYSGEFHRAVRRGDHATRQAVQQGFARISAAELRQIDLRWLGRPLQERFQLEKLLPFAVGLVAVGVLLLAWVWGLRRTVARRTAELRRAMEAREREAHQARSTGAYLQAVLDAVHDGIAVHDPDTGNWVDVNQRLVELYGYSRAELLKMTVGDETAGEPPYSRSEALAWLERARREGPQIFPWQVLHPDGHVIPVEVNARYDEGSGEGRIVVTVRDVTERRRHEEERQRLESQVRHAQKLESLGVLAGGIAHDFNNLLMSILGHASLAQAGACPHQQALQQITVAAERAAELARQMLAYAGKGRVDVGPTDLSALVDELGSMLEASLSKKVELVRRLDRELPAVQADATQLRQVLLNLVLNGAEAIGERTGTVTVTTGCRAVDQAELAATWVDDRLPAGSYVWIEVADTGCGISPEILPKIFDPFFSTKFTGRGLGMAAVLGIVRGHRGAISVRTEVGHGTSFTVLLPASAAPARSTSRSPSLTTWEGEGLVLLVDDEESVRLVTRRMLERLGFQVELARDGQEAVEAFARRPDDFVLVLLDLTMPRLDGAETQRELQRLRPGVCTVLSSGYGEQELTERFRDAGFAGFVQKPFSLDTLSQVMRRVLRR